jgi:hypothetical protein
MRTYFQVGVIRNKLLSTWEKKWNNWVPSSPNRYFCILGLQNLRSATNKKSFEAVAIQRGNNDAYIPAVSFLLGDMSQ